MHVVHLSTYPDGGAGIAARRLHEGLLSHGVASAYMGLREPARPMEGFVLYRHEPNLYDKVDFWVNPNRWRAAKAAHSALLPGYDWFSSPDSPLRSVHMADFLAADVIHLHWVAEMINWPTFFARVARMGKPIVWTMHDMNPLTGGCHYSGDCGQFLQGCHSCPQLDPTMAGIVAGYHKRRTTSLARGLALGGIIQPVTPGNWMASQVAASVLMRVLPAARIIPYSLPTSIFNREAQTTSLEGLKDLPPGPRLLFVADDLANRRKGFGRLLEALALLPTPPAGEQIVCLAVGRNQEPPTIPPNVHYRPLGHISEPAQMAAAYRAADLFVIASLEDNFPNTVLEALCTGTPVVGYQATGVADMVSSHTGVLAEELTAPGLAKAISNAMSQTWDRPAIAAQAQALYHPDRQAKAYLALYQELCDQR